MTIENSDDKRKPEFGLALSGGGFRASFFHLGVLASLAERGVLHRFEIISAVSGGSIIAALYYLRVRELLMSKCDPSSGQPSKVCLGSEDYVRLVRDMIEEFRKGVQKNVRTRVMTNLWKNFKMISPTYSRSDRTSELYADHIYVHDRKMKDLKIYPKCGPESFLDSFKPIDDNEPRTFRVPVLLLNSTCLNSGHNWRFEAKCMGEPDIKTDDSDRFDKNMTLERPKTWGVTPRAQQDLTLADAVAASASVPGLFHPLSISDMYQPYGDKGEEVRAQLVDGGVHDNLGVQGLLDRDCRYMLISDASGQMDDQVGPRTSVFNVVFRVYSIYSDRLREEQLRRLRCERKDSHVLVDLRYGVQRKTANYRGSKSVETDSEDAPAKTKSPVFSEEVQLLLSGIRTDLDSFNDLEAGALMADGYRIANKEAPNWKTLTADPPPTEELAGSKDWWFKQTIPLLENPDKTVKKQLKHGRRQFAKVLFLRPYCTIACLLAIYVAPVVAVITWFGWWGKLAGPWETTLAQVADEFGYSFLGFLGFLGLLLLLWLLDSVSKRFPLLRYVHWLASGILRFVFRFLPSLAIWVVAWIHLNVFDRLYLKYGDLSQTQKS